MQDLCCRAVSARCGEFSKMSKAWDVVVWWELRRILYNLALLAIGLGSIFAMEAIGGRMVQAGEDFVEPMFLLFGVIAYGIAANLCYTLGWITELLWSAGDISRTERVRPKIFRIGFCFSAGLTALPAALMVFIWAFAGFK